VGPGHGIEATIRSIPRWLSKSWGFVVVGPADPKFAGTLRALAEELGVAEQFVVLPPVSYDEVSSLTVDADLGHALYDPVNINHVEAGTSSNKLLEYMAAGVPVLLSNTASFSDLLGRVGCGVLAAPDDSQAIAAAVNRVLADPDLGRELGGAGKAAFDEELNYDLHFAQLKLRLDELNQSTA
jgi:glycosyltransferase involved in cell wall biosynthesis